MTRLTFIGDIALDKPLLKAAKERGKGVYDFSGVFHTEDVFRDSDLVIGNLETVFGGGSRYNTKPYHYNSPDSFCRAVKDAGIGLVSTANNHCMDEGAAGLHRTLRVLDENGIAHTGTYADETENRYLIREINGVRIAFYSLTYSVNVGMESLSCDDLYRHVNLIGFRGKRMSVPKRYYQYVIRQKLRQIRKKLSRQSTIAASTDTYSESKINNKWMAEIESQIRKARAESDLLVVLLHIGGQFNTEPGTFSTFMVEKLSALGADVIVGNHPHTVQAIREAQPGGGARRTLIAYSLGGYCMSVSGEYLVHECLPEYSLALHVDLDEKGNYIGYSADVLKGTEDENAYLTVARAGLEDTGALRIAERYKG